MSNPLNNELLGNPLSSSANAGQYEVGDTISTIHGDMEVTGVDFMGRPQVDRYGEDLNWEDSFGPASKHLGVSEAEWKAFISGVNEIKAEMREYEGNDARVMQRRSQGEDPTAERRIGVLMNTQGLTREEAENEVYNSEQYLESNAQFEQYNELNQQLNDLYASVGLDPTGAIQGSKTNSPGYAVSFDFVSGDVSHTKGDAIHDIGKMAIMAAAGVIAGPALAGALGGILGPAAAKAASSAIINLASQYMTTGEVDWKQALISAATSYGGAKLGEALKGSSALGGIGDKISGVTDKFNEVLDKTGDIGSAAIKAGGMSMLTQMVTTGEIDVKQAGLAALMAAGSTGLSEWQASMEAAGIAPDEYMQDLAEYEEFQQAAIDADVKDPFLNPNYKTVGDGVIVHIDTGEVFGYNSDKSLGTLDDLDLDGDGMLSGADLQEVNVPDRDLVDPSGGFGYEMGDDVYVDADGNPVDPDRVKFGPDGYVVDGKPVTIKPYNEVYGGDRGGLVWSDEGNEYYLNGEVYDGEIVYNADGYPTTPDGQELAYTPQGDIRYENGELAYKKVDGQWVDADGNVVDDPQLVDELTGIAAGGIDDPLNRVQYFDQDGNPVNYKYTPHNLRDNLEDGQFSGLIFGPNGEIQEVWYDPTTGTEYIKSDKGFIGVEQVELPETTPDPVEPETTEDTTTDSPATGDPNESTSPGKGDQGGGDTDSTGGAGFGGAIGGGGTLGGGAEAGGPSGGSGNVVDGTFDNPLTGGPNVGDPITDIGDVDPSDGTGDPTQVMNAQIQALMDQGMTYDEAVANQNAAIAAGADANNDGMVTDAEWQAHTTGAGTGAGGEGGEAGGTDTGAGTGGVGEGAGSGSGATDGSALGEGTGTGQSGSGSGSGASGDTAGGDGVGGGVGDGGGVGEGSGGGEGGGFYHGGSSGAGVGSGTEPGAGGGAGGGGAGDGVGSGMLSGGFDKYTPQWGELFEYTTLTPYQAKQLEPVRQYIAKARGMLS